MFWIGAILLIFSAKFELVPLYWFSVPCYQIFVPRIDLNTLKIPHLKIAHLGGNLEVGNIDIQGYQDCPPQLRDVFLCS